VWVVRVVRLVTRKLARSVRRMVALPRPLVGRAPLPVDPIARALVRRPPWVAISERVILRVVPRSPRVVPPVPARVAARVLPAARAVPARAELVGPRPAARVVSPTVGRAARSERVLVVTPARRPLVRPRVAQAPRVRAVTAATPTVVSRSPRLSP